MTMPMEHLEARICELAGHLTAAMCQFLLLIADFDARGGWASWEMPSCAAWLSWKCQIASGTAREHVRVARLLGGFPSIREEFTAGRLSYAKVRALTRIATPETERDLVAMASLMTANQMERFAQAHRRVSRGEQREVNRRRKLTWRYDQDKAIGITVWLPPAEGAVVLQALRACSMTPPATCSASAAAPASRRAGCGARPANATGTAAGSPDVSHGASTCTTSCSGPAAARPNWPTSSAYASGTTPSCTTGASSSPLDLQLAIWICFANAKAEAPRGEREQSAAS